MHKNRLLKLRQSFGELKIDGVLITDPDNVFYLSGFTGYGDGKLFITAERAYLITDSRYEIQAVQEAKDFSLCIASRLGDPAFRQLIANSGVRFLGFEDKTISFDAYRGLTELLDFVSFLPIGETVTQLRMIKEVFEIRIIKKACSIAAAAFAEEKERIVPGCKELEVASALEYNMRQRGALRTSFDTIVASGPRSAMPHGVAGERVIQQGDCVTVDFGAFYHGYCSDMTRTVFAEGPASAKLQEIYQIVQAAQEAAIRGFYTGMPAYILDQLARDYITRQGYGPCFGHSLGHGVGICVHEAPYISPRGTALLKPGMVFSIEPGIYKEGVGGVRIEDLVVVRENGLEILTRKGELRENGGVS